MRGDEYIHTWDTTPAMSPSTCGIVPRLFPGKELTAVAMMRLKMPTAQHLPNKSWVTWWEARRQLEMTDAFLLSELVIAVKDEGMWLVVL